MRLSLRSLWAPVTPITIAVCAMFAAKSAGNILSAGHLADRSEAAPTQRVQVQPGQTKAEVRSKSAASIVARNIFCSTCSADTPISEQAQAGTRTRLPLRLIATNIASENQHSFASVLNTSDQRQGGYRVGQNIPGAGIVESISHELIEFRNQETKRIESLHLDGADLTQVAPSRAAASTSNQLAQEYVRVLSANHFEVDRKLVEKLKGDPSQAGARARPVIKDGKMTGVRLFALRSSGLAHSMGLRNGDTLVAANGVKLSSYEAGLELMGQLQRKDNWSMDILRRGKPLTIQVDLQ